MCVVNRRDYRARYLPGFGLISDTNPKPWSLGGFPRLPAELLQRGLTSTSTLEGWVGHPLDPIGCLFTTLTETCRMDDDSGMDTGGTPAERRP